VFVEPDGRVLEFEIHMRSEGAESAMQLAPAGWRTRGDVETYCATGLQVGAS
jgi:hypothetical protein